MRSKVTTLPGSLAASTGFNSCVDVPNAVVAVETPSSGNVTPANHGLEAQTAAIRGLGSYSTTDDANQRAMHFKTVYDLIRLVGEFLQEGSFYSFIEAFRITKEGAYLFYQFTQLPYDTEEPLIENRLLKAWQAYYIEYKHTFVIASLPYPAPLFYFNLRARLCGEKPCTFLKINLDTIFQKGQKKQTSIETVAHLNLQSAMDTQKKKVGKLVQDILSSGIRYYYLNTLLVLPTFIGLLAILILKIVYSHNLCLVRYLATSSDFMLGGDCDNASIFALVNSTCRQNSGSAIPCQTFQVYQALPVYSCNNVRSGNYSAEFSKQIIAVMLQACSSYRVCSSSQPWIQHSQALWSHCDAPDKEPTDPIEIYILIATMTWLGLAFCAGMNAAMIAEDDIIRQFVKRLSYLSIVSLSLAWITLSGFLLPPITLIHALFNLSCLGFKTLQAAIDPYCFSKTSTARYKNTMRFFTLKKNQMDGVELNILDTVHI